MHVRRGSARKGLVVALLVYSLMASCRSSSDSDALVIRMTGDDYRWEVRYPGPDGRLDTRDDVLDTRDLNVPEGTKVRVLLESWDYVYTLAVPEFGLKEIVVPDMAFELRLPASEPGSFQLLGDHMCGYDHPELIGTLVVWTRNDYERWLATADEERER